MNDKQIIQELYERAAVAGKEADYDLARILEIAAIRIEALREAHEPNSTPSGPDFLAWVAERLVNVYNESPNVDFVLALKRKADKARNALRERGSSRELLRLV